MASRRPNWDDHWNISDDRHLLRPDPETLHTNLQLLPHLQELHFIPQSRFDTFKPNFPVVADNMNKVKTFYRFVWTNILYKNVVHFLAVSDLSSLARLTISIPSTIRPAKLASLGRFGWELRSNTHELGKEINLMLGAEYVASLSSVDFYGY